MQLFQKQVRKQIKETRDLLDRIQRFQKTVPKGSLIITHKQKKIYYKWQYHEENLKYIRKYLSKKEEKQIQLLAQKGYYEKVEPILPIAHAKNPQRSPLRLRFLTCTF